MSKSLVQQQFGAHAAGYVTSAVHAKGASLERMVELASPAQSWQVLDVATAAGHTALAFAPHVARVTATDITPEMLDEAARLARSRGADNIEFARADAEALPFAEASFDLVTCRIAAHHFPDVAAFVREARRVLRPGGKLVLVDNVSPGPEIVAGHGAGELGEAAAAYNEFEKLRDPSHGRCLTTAEWLRLLAGEGFAVVHCEHLFKQMEFAPWLARMSVDAATGRRLEAMLTGAGPALAAFLQPRRTDGALWFTLCELLVVAARPS